MKKHKSSVKFFQQPWVKKNGKAAICLIYRCNNTARWINTGLEVEPGWKHEECKDEYIIDELNNLKVKVRHIEKKLLEEFGHITPSDVFLMLKLPYSNQTSQCISTFIDKYLGDNEKRKRCKSLKRYLLLKNKITEWGDGVKFKEMNLENINNFKSWLTDEIFNDNTVKLIMRLLISIMKIADENYNLEVHQSYRNYNNGKINLNIAK